MRFNVIHLYCLLIFLLVPVASELNAQEKETKTYSEQDRLRGAVTAEREWWDVQHYHLAVEVFIEQKRLVGSNTISFKTVMPGSRMQIDLQEPLAITKVIHDKTELAIERDENVYWVTFAEELKEDSEEVVQVFYEGTPVESANPPWSGGLTWQTDNAGNPFIATTCQGIGASIWWPNKDHGSDEPDRGMKISITVPGNLVAVANGRLKETVENPGSESKTFHWEVASPINNYCVNMNIGNYVNFSETFDGEGGKLDCEYWVLKNDREAAEKQFKEAPRTLAAFEHWFGPYPFYEDSYKLVQVPYLGMEHQSSVTYGNDFKNGYRGRDLSATGVGLLFDFIIVHESGHEWFGNNISMKDGADMWIHESFTNYSENLFVEYHFDEKQAQDYVIGCRKLVQNDIPIIAEYNVNARGSGDMYYKGGNMLHSMRHIISDDKKWREILRGLNKEFWHQTVTTRQIEDFINEKSGIDFSKFFDQYLRSTKIPRLCVDHIDGGTKLEYWYDNVVEGFDYPVEVLINGKTMRLTPKQEKQTLSIEAGIESVEVDRNFYVEQANR